MIDPVLEIKSRLSIEDLVKDYVQLKRAGRNLKGLCPFHEEKTPSFMVSPDKGIAYCFGCHKGGDIFKFYMEAEHIEFNEALHDLADRVGIQIDYKVTTLSPINQQQKQQLKAVLKKTTEFFQEQLKESATAQQYLKERDVSPEIQAQFALGYAPDSWEKLTTYLKKSGFSIKDLITAGVAIPHENNKQECHDKFRDRIIFPFFNDRSEIIGFTGRALTNDNQPKYLNSPDSPVFHKSSFIYGLYQAKSTIKKASNVLVVEGQIDCLSCVQHGLLNTVAVSGTAFTSKHLDMLRRLTEKITFIFDGDQAGNNAALRIIPEVIAKDVAANFVVLPVDKDPDSLIRENSDQFAFLMNENSDWLDFIYRAFFTSGTIKEDGEAKRFLQMTIPLIKRMPHPIDQESMVKKIAKYLGKSEHLIYRTLEKTRISHEAAALVPERKKQDIILFTLAFLCHFPQFCDHLIDRNIQELLPEMYQDIYRIAYQYYSSPRASSDVSDLLRQFSDGFPQDDFSLLLLQIEEHYGEYTATRLVEEKEIILKRIKRELLKVQMVQVKEQLKIAKENNDKPKEKELLAKSIHLLQIQI